MEEDLCQKTTFDRVCSILPETNIYDSSPWQPQHNWPHRKSYQLSKPEKEFHVIEEIYVASRMHMCEEKTTLLGKDD